MVITIARDLLFDLRRGGGSALELLYGEVSISPTMLHSVSTSVVLPAPTKADLIAGKATFTQVAPSPDPVDGQVAWAYKVVIKDRRGMSWEYLVGLPDGVPPINFNVLPRYFETKPPLFGEGPQGPAGTAATVAVGTVDSGSTPAVTNSGTSTNAVLNFTLAQGPAGPKGDGVALVDTLFSALPSTYSTGVTLGNATTANGWPASFVLVTTERRLSGRTVQRLVDVNNTYIQQRTEISGNAWSAFKTVAWDAEATTSVKGLLSAVDKAKLDNLTLATNSKLFTDLASSYPTGFSTGLMRASDGWPGTGICNITTQKNPGTSAGAVQWITPEGISTPNMYRVSRNVSGNPWSDVRILATDSDISKMQQYATPEQYGAVGNGTTDDSNAIELAINANLTSGKDVLFDSAKTYRITRPIISTVPALGQQFSVGLGSTGSAPATIRMDNDGHRHFEFTGAALTPTTLTQTVKLQRRAWKVASASEFRVGMLFSVISSDSWFYDPRPDTTDARVSEIHRVAAIDGTTIYSEAPSADGYNVSASSITVTPIQPIRVDVGNLILTRPVPAFVGPTEDLTYVGIRLDYTSSSTLENLVVEHACSNAVQLRRSYETYITGNKIVGTNSYGSGYAITVQGSNFTTVKGNYITTTRRAVDVTAWVRLISRNTFVLDNTYVGGGKNIRGEWMGWDPVTGDYGARNGGFGGHGVSDLTTMTGNITSDCWEPFVVRGSNNVYSNNIHVGNARVAAFGLDSGGGTIVISDNKVLSGWLGTPKYQSGANAERARDFTRIGDGLDDNSRVTVTGNYAEVGNAFVLLGNRLASTVKMVRFLVVSGNTVGLSDGTTDKGALLYNPSTVVEPIGSGRYWTIGPNTIRNDSLAAQATTTRNVNIAGAKVIDYTTSGATT